MIIHKLKQTIKDFDLIQPKDHIVIGVSGGADSVSLLYLFNQIKHEYDFLIYVAHLNHLLRQEESQRDEDFVRKLCDDFNLPFLCERIDAKAFAGEKKLCLEDAARKLRYDFFKRVCEKVKAKKIATAHTLDDQAETVLMRVICGTGPAGLEGMCVTRAFTGNIKLIRPLLFVSKNEIIKYAQKNDIKFCEDSSNFSNEPLRNKLRNELIPAIENSCNPKFKENLIKLAECIKEDNIYINKTLEKNFSFICSELDSENGTIYIDRNRYMCLEEEIKNRFLRYAVIKLKNKIPRLDNRHFQILKDFFNTAVNGKQCDLPAIRARAYKDVFVIKNLEL